MSRNNLSKYFENINIENLMTKKKVFIQNFRIYADIVDLCYEKGKTRKCILKKAKMKFEKMTACSIPVGCFLSIFHYFTNEMLKVFIEETN